MSLHLDFETTSRVDLRKVGASRYAADPSTQVLCVAYSNGVGPVRGVIRPKTHHIEDILTNALMTSVTPTIHAWNASFERAILRHKYAILPGEWDCTMQRSLYAGYPAALEMAAHAMNAPFRKDMAGYKLMMKMNKPRADGTFWHDDPILGPKMLQDLLAYCKQDVIAEVTLAKVLPPLPPQEQKLSVLDEMVNFRGIGLDIPLIRRLIEIAKQETALLNDRAMQLTNGAVSSAGTQTARLLSWFRARGFDLGSTDKATMLELLNAAGDIDIPDDVLELASIRQKIAKSSTAKLQKMLDCAEQDERVRGTLFYYGARTGRWAGKLIQPQNMPSRGVVKTVSAAIDELLGASSCDADWIRTFHGEPMFVVSSCLRGCLIPTKGNIFFVFDFNQIEARALAWVAGQYDLLQIFESGADVYTEVANQLGLGSRDAGKVAVLGLGYGMGWKRFIEYAATYGLTLSPEQAVAIVDDYRRINYSIRQLWYDLDQLIKGLLRAGVGASTTHRGMHLRIVQDLGWGSTLGGSLALPVMLTIELPNGQRHLHYHNIRLLQETDPNGLLRYVIAYDGLDDKDHWVPIRIWGAKVVENIVQAIARDIMAEAAIRVEAQFKSVGLVLSVHDELVFEAEDNLGTTNKANFDAVLQVIEERPDWAPSLPVAAGGKIMWRYGK